MVVADRGADIYEHLRQCRQQGLGFVVRAAQDGGLVMAAGAPATTLFAVARVQPGAGQIELPLRARPGQAARVACLRVSYSPLLAVRAPQRPGASAGKDAPVAASVVRVWEPAGKLEWLLLCDDVIATNAQARERARQYASRWLIEDFHKALKTGLGAERLQLHTAPRLFAAVALLSVVWWTCANTAASNPMRWRKRPAYPPLIYRSCGASAPDLSKLCKTSSMPWRGLVAT